MIGKITKVISESKWKSSISERFSMNGPTELDINSLIFTYFAQFFPRSVGYWLSSKINI